MLHFNHKYKISILRSLESTRRAKNWLSEAQHWLLETPKLTFSVKWHGITEAQSKPLGSGSKSTLRVTNLMWYRPLESIQLAELKFWTILAIGNRFWLWESIFRLCVILGCGSHYWASGSRLCACRCQFSQSKILNFQYLNYSIQNWRL